MKPTRILSAILVIALISCHKDAIKPNNPPASDTSLKLKDITERNLPSPYYHFEYNDSGKITVAGYSSGLRIYGVHYNGTNISTMENTTSPFNNLRLEYVYINNELTAVRVRNENGVVTRQCILDFTPSHQLKQLDWSVADGNVGFYYEQTIALSYYGDGNLMEMVTHNYAVGSQTESTYTDRFEDYDTHPNADAFSLIHTNQHELVLLPGIRIQANNPRREVRTGDGISYEVNYTYSYDGKGRPVTKTGDVKFTNGTDAGQHFESQSTFSYYD